MPKKNVLAILSGVIAIVLAAVAVLLRGEPWSVIGATVAFVAAAVWGIRATSVRNPLVMALTAAGSAILFAYFDNFWGLFVAALVVLWAAFGLLPLMDSAWRVKLGFVAAVFVGAVVALWPTMDGFFPARGAPEAGLGPVGKAWQAVGSHLHCPTYLKDRVGFAIAPGLDLSGGLRLVYTVEVDDAIRDKRDHFADEMREALTTAFALHTGDGRVTRDELSKLADKVHVSEPEAALIRLKFNDKADKAKIDERFTKKFLGELSQNAGPGENEV
ncbi:MAG TPA: hypothetical protein VK841_26765, partial [Polyangiaceae bacterium]|nr:hypothetical protein [Polyangiaceae bacterium]